MQNHNGTRLFNLYYKDNALISHLDCLQVLLLHELNYHTTVYIGNSGDHARDIMCFVLQTGSSNAHIVMCSLAHLHHKFTPQVTILYYCVHFVSSSYNNKV